MRFHLPRRLALKPVALAAAALLMTCCANLAGGHTGPPTSLAAHHGTTTTATTTTTTTIAATTTTTGLGTSPTGSAPCSAPPLAPPAAGLVVGRVTAVGDSVMIDIEPYLQADVSGVVFNADVGQQWYSGVSDVQQARADGQLGSVVVIELGTNGPITAQLFDQMMSALQGVSRVVFVTNYVPDYWQDPNNAIIEAGAKQYKDVAVANWYALAAANPGWLCGDHTHLSCGGPGAQEMAALVAKCI
jgi:hypothetical protein